jgi:S-adenosylmethionine:tRNA ribosyltransferase-isomerase
MTTPVHRSGFARPPANAVTTNLQFELPSELEAAAPAEARGLRRDEVRLLVSDYTKDVVAEGLFYQLPDFLQAGDLLVINTSGTLAAALQGRREGGLVGVHISTQISAEPRPIAVIELRTCENTPLFDGRAGETIALPDGRLRLLAPHNRSRRLWLAAFEIPVSLNCFLKAHGRPIRYSYVRDSWGIESYQTVFAEQMGSAEMPSAGRAFTPELVTRLVNKGVVFAPVTLHTGVASVEAHEPPYEEWFAISAESALRINRAKADGRRIIAIGTTAVRAVESAVDNRGQVQAKQGWTDRLITPEQPPQIIDSLLTGFHEPAATHLAMLSAIASTQHLEHVYNMALQGRYLWHEFGDLHLLTR